MNIINIDWKQYIDGMDEKDVCIIDPPWNYNQKILETNQITYDRLINNEFFLNYMFRNIRTKHILLWTTNSMLFDVFKSNHSDFIYKNCVTWVKKTKNDKLFYGMGYSFRNCTEQLLLFTKKKAPALNTKLRNIIFATTGARTLKPKEEELKILTELNLKFNKFAYIFSGKNIKLFENLNIDCVDICFNNKNNQQYEKFK